MNSNSQRVVVVGGGIVGLATARAYLLRFPGSRVTVLEKESAIGQHQTSHNSGVIHSGVYYTPGSLKAQLCTRGHQAMLAFCESRGIPYRRCGKLIVAITESERPRLQAIYDRGLANGLDGLRLMDAAQIREIEPHVVGIAGIYVPHTGVVDFARVAQTYAHDIEAAGGEIILNTHVKSVVNTSAKARVITADDAYEADRVVTCAGLHSDKISETGDELRIVPFRGSYYVLSQRATERVRALIYPVPDPRFPFLGVHFTRTIRDSVLVGPNAVLAMAREGYRRRDMNPRDLFATITYPGFVKLALRYWRTGLLEWIRDYSKRLYLRHVQQYIPDIELEDLLPGPAGVRAQALDAGGSLLDDFRIKWNGSVIHVQNAPSPAATSSLVIGEYIVDQLAL